MKVWRKPPILLVLKAFWTLPIVPPCMPAFYTWAAIYCIVASQKGFWIYRHFYHTETLKIASNINWCQINPDPLAEFEQIMSELAFLELVYTCILIALFIESLSISNTCMLPEFGLLAALRGCFRGCILHCTSQIPRPCTMIIIIIILYSCHFNKVMLSFKHFLWPAFHLNALS